MELFKHLSYTIISKNIPSMDKTYYIKDEFVFFLNIMNYHKAFQQLVRLNLIDLDYLDYPVHHQAQDQESYQVLVYNVALVH